MGWNKHKNRKTIREITKEIRKLLDNRKEVNAR